MFPFFKPLNNFNTNMHICYLMWKGAWHFQLYGLHAGVCQTVRQDSIWKRWRKVWKNVNYLRLWRSKCCVGSLASPLFLIILMCCCWYFVGRLCFCCAIGCPLWRGCGNNYLFVFTQSLSSRDNGVKAFFHSLHPSKENKIILK